MPITIVEPSATFSPRDPTKTREGGIILLQNAEFYGRTSHRSEGKQTPTSYDRFIRTWTMDRGDFSFIEHEKVSCLFETDRGISHEVVRHRLGSYTQESTRFVRYLYDTLAGRPRWICPQEIQSHPKLFSTWQTSRVLDETEYDTYLAAGLAPELARGALGHFLATQYVVTYNLRQWRYFFLARTSREAHPQMRQITIPLLEEFQSKIPILYEDIVPNQSQRQNFRMVH